jgi:hypothetical protein
LRDFDWSENDIANIDPNLLDHIAIRLTKPQRDHLVKSLGTLHAHNFPFDKGNGNLFLTNLVNMTEPAQDLFVAFLLKLINTMHVTRVVPFLLSIHSSTLPRLTKEYITKLSCDLFGLSKILDTFILNPELNLSEPFLEFFVKTINFSVDTYIRQLNLAIIGLREEINMVYNEEDRQLMEEEYLPLIQNLENKLEILQRLQ